jgi:hypothetical protein
VSPRVVRRGVNGIEGLSVLKGSESIEQNRETEHDGRKISDTKTGGLKGAWRKLCPLIHIWSSRVQRSKHVKVHVQLLRNGASG